MRPTQKIAVSGMLTALAGMLMLLANVVPSGSYAVPAGAGAIVYIISFTVDRTYAWTAFAAVSLLGFFLCGDKEAVCAFVLFFGYYPLVKRLLEKIRLWPLVWLLKLLVFNAAALVTYWLLLKVFGLPEDSFQIFGVSLPWVLLVLLNGMFCVYDYAFTRFFSWGEPRINRFVTNLCRRF